MKTLVVYYGYGNHTNMIAKKLEKELNADVIKIEPKVAYTNNYQLLVDQTENNLETRETPDIKDIDINLHNYNKIIIGTPVWWYTIAPPIRTFLKKYDLSNLKVYPFTTNAGWPGSTFDEIKSLCNGEIKYPMNILFSTDHKENKILTNELEISNWINNIKND